VIDAAIERSDRQSLVESGANISLGFENSPDVANVGMPAVR
jgi:hypothetical protein